MIDATMMFPMAAILGIGFLVASEAATRPSEAPVKTALKRSGATQDLSACWHDLAEENEVLLECQNQAFADKAHRAKPCEKTAFPVGLVAS